MNSLDLSYLGGLPLTQADMQFMQNGYSAPLAAIAALVGDKVIISGMVEAGGNVSDGWISLGGELLPFTNGAIGTGKFTIQQTTVNRTFHDGTIKAIRISRAAVFSATGAYNYSDLRRIDTLKKMWCLGDQKPVHCNAAYIAANFDVTGKGIAGTEREGWAICNGNNGTEDLRGYFLMGYDDRSIDPANGIWDIVYNTIGGTGGEKSHQLTINEMPSHTHSVPGPNVINEDEPDWDNTGGAGSNYYGTPASKNTSSVGADQAHENRPPFKVKLYIEKIA